MQLRGNSARIRRALWLVCGVVLPVLPFSAAIVERIAIKVNEEIVTQYEITQMEQEMRTELQRTGKPVPANFKQKVNEQLVNDRLVEQLAKKEGIMVSRVEVDERMNLLMRAQSMDPATFREGLAREGLTYESFYEQMRKKMIMQKLFNKSPVAASITASDAEIEALYQKYAPEEFHIMHLYISLPPGASFAQRNDREQKIKNVETALAQNPWGFAQVAAANADMWRDWGFVLPGPDLPQYLIPAFSRLQWGGQVFSYRVVNEIPGFPGFHALLLANKRRVALDTVRDRLSAVIREEKLNDAIETWLASLRKEASIIYMP